MKRNVNLIVLSWWVVLVSPFVVVSSMTTITTTQSRRSFVTAAASTLVFSRATSSVAMAATDDENAQKIQLIPTQFIAALGDPKSNAGTNAKDWGLWTVDPGPRGVFLQNYKQQIVSNNSRGPYGWKFDPQDWWLEEHGIIMEQPDFPLKPGKYLVTGGRQMTTILTIDQLGGWNLQDGTLYDVTHLPCRSARYTPSSKTASCNPSKANVNNFPVKPGGVMPSVNGCNKQDYAVLFVKGKVIDSKVDEL